MLPLGYLFSLTWQYEQNVSTWQSKHGCAPFFLTIAGCCFSHGTFGFEPWWWQLLQNDVLWQLTHWAFL